MSSRNFRKMNKENTLPPPPDDSDDDYQPLYAKNSGLSKYAGLDVSSPSQSEQASEPSEEDSKENASPPPKSTGAKKKNLKKKGKGKGDRDVADELDEVERSVKEVNDLLGSLPAPQPPPPKQIQQALEVLTVDPKHLNVANEIKRVYGAEAEKNKRGRTTQNRVLLLKRVLIHPDAKTPVYDFNNSGLSMMKYKDKENRMYFVFNHSDDYQKMHRNFLRKFVAEQGSGEIVTYFEEAKQKMHVEALLEISDRFFRMEENGVANEIVENVITFLQYVADPLFILSKNNVRLDYKFMENRAFFVAMLKYVYLLSNRACHRSALEITKMLLLLDPNDPLALLSIIDILALRAREHEWLIETVKYFDRQREAGLLFNIKFSNSLAHFHVANKNKRSLAEADELIRDAILAFPNVFTKILECCHVSNPKLLKHVIFKPDDPITLSGGASDMFLIYAKMSAPRWNESEVMGWLLRNATELCKSYDTDLKIRDTAKCWSISRCSLYKVWPKEYLRHVSVVSTMSKLLIDTPLPQSVSTCAWDPLFHKSVNRYSYSYDYEPSRMDEYNRLVAWVAARAGGRNRRNEEEVGELNAAQLNATQIMDPFLGVGVYMDCGVMYLSRPMYEPEAHFAQPNANTFADHRTFVPGFHMTLANWNVGYIYPDLGTGGSQNSNDDVKDQQPISSLDLAFDDMDPDFEDYDYADDAANFARDDDDMARALAAEGPGEFTEWEEPNNAE